MALALVFLILCIISASLMPALIFARIRASGPFKVTLTTTGFGQALEATAIDLSDPAHALIALQNGTPFWYSIGVQSTPAGITPAPAGSSDLLTSTFYNTTPLLPPVSALPLNLSQNSVGQATSLKLALAFTSPGQQVSITLNPFEAHAALLDALSLLLHLLGENGDGAQIGLLAPGALQALFSAANSMQYLQSFTNDYLSLLQAVVSSSASGSSTGGQNDLFQPAYTCASDLVALVSDTTERAQLADMLWRLLGKTIAPASINATLATFGQAQFGLGMLGYLKDNALAVGRTLFEQNNPVVTLQSISGLVATPTAVTPSPGATVMPQLTSTPTAKP